jgi:hypothetical protein
MKEKEKKGSKKKKGSTHIFLRFSFIFQRSFGLIQSA